jgi:hypothetical protein
MVAFLLAQSALTRQEGVVMRQVDCRGAIWLRSCEHDYVFLGSTYPFKLRCGFSMSFTNTINYSFTTLDMVQLLFCIFLFSFMHT